MGHWLPPVVRWPHAGNGAALKSIIEKRERPVVSVFLGDLGVCLRKNNARNGSSS